MAETCPVAQFVKAHGGTKVIKRILIANNGMAATKAIISMRKWAFVELGSETELKFVAMASADDLKANAEFIRLADAFVEVPPGKNSNNYAKVSLICEIAQQQAVDAVWPGWGHASENPELPRKLAEIGITFLGPSAPVMHALGDKIASTILAQSSKVPCIPWNGDGIFAEIQSDGSIPQEPFKKACLQSFEEALECAKRIGYPVVLKASEGGGGKGIRKCQNDDELKSGWEQVTTEVVGSPIFMMQLCTGARHLEVQLVGDSYGDVVALIGRDCSTQRRFQKIFEEGPPTIAPRESFREAEKAAQRLAMSVKYCGAGTVEYLYKPAANEFYFLELNPRLQVEHPVTEGITGVNVPALQLQIGMGVPLSRVPDIRRFYGLDPTGSTPIDFLETPYVYPDSHVIAARVTAENPDDAFRPTSGKIESVRFQSSPAAWGYFSIGKQGAIHEFADSQFGHIFAKGPTREDARKALQLALKTVHISGEIRTPVEYLVELAETQEFRENTIDTAWLDRLIAEKTVKTKFHTLDAVFYAACFRAHTQVAEQTSAVLDKLKRGHLPLHNDLRLLQSFVVEVAYDSTKYVFRVTRVAENLFAFSIGEDVLEARIREQPDGSLYIKTGETVTQVSGVDEALGLRLRIEGSATITFPKLRDPSELRSDFNGKVVRYLHADGADVAEGEPFVELEAMKMIMSLRTTASGKIHQALNSGAIVAAGQLLANLDLKDPSSVQTVKAFSGDFSLSGSQQTTPLGRTRSAAGDMCMSDVATTISACIRGYGISPLVGATATTVVQRLFVQPGGADEDLVEQSIVVSGQLLATFLEKELFFAGLVGGDETQIIAKFEGEPEELLASIMAHDALPETLLVVASLLRGLSHYYESRNIEQVPLHPQLKQRLEELSKLPKEGYGELIMLSTKILYMAKSKSLTERRGEVHSKLKSVGRSDMPAMALQGPSGDAYFGLDLVATLFKDEDLSVRSKAVELYIRRLHRGYTMVDFEVVTSKEVVDSTPAAYLHAMWTFQLPGLANVDHVGYLVVLPSAADFESLKSSWVLPSVPALSVVHIIVADVSLPEMRDVLMRNEAMQKLIDATGSFVEGVSAAVDAKKCSLVNALLISEAVKPTSLHYSKENGWKEILEYRNVRPTFPYLMDLDYLRSEFNLTPLYSTRRITAFLGAARDRKTETILVRSLFQGEVAFDRFDTIVVEQLLEAFDMIEHVLLDPSLDVKKIASRILVHSVFPIPHSTERDLNFLRVAFDRAIQKLTAHGSTLLKLRVETVELKVWVGSPAIPLLLTASSITGWETVAQKEASHGWVELAPGSGQVVRSTTIDTVLHDKRKIARKEGTTYIYDFLALFRFALTKIWLNSQAESMPDQIFIAEEYALNKSGELEHVQRPNGKNNVGMIVWRCTLRTPEYPGGRTMILIGNDLTIKAGTFGVTEDEVFQKASAMARAMGVPRIHIACNSGARLGAVEELKKLVQVAWSDPSDPNKGFDYLYLEPNDFANLPPDSVASHEVQVAGKTRHVLDAIVGLNFPSTKGGIGVENLQGSGLIAGETSRAYEETFTLSYVTGRSVGIGAYLNRLGQRNIQMVKGPMILTGFQAINKLLGQHVYTTQDQLGGPHIMVPNGVTHQLVHNDQDGIEAVLRWLSYIPDTNTGLPPIIKTTDSIDREVQFMPTKAPYDPRHMLAGAKVDGEFMTGFCDEGSFQEYMVGWGKTVVVGRGRVGGLPVGIIAVETRSVIRHIPADPADIKSHDIQEAQAGQVWFPDSAFKTAQAIRDFNRGENLPLIIFANWRGFSGGTRDMFAEVLKYGAMIVDALVDYKHPVTIYIPPCGELRGGAWVVLDPKINPNQMEMFADVESRGGILEPPAAAEIVFKRDAHVIEMMHRCDDELCRLDKEAAAGKDVSKDVKAREKLLLPVYRQVSVEYCDLHDRSDRMKGLGAIHEQLQWRTSRTYLHWRIRRRLLEGGVVKQVKAVVPDISHTEAKATVDGLVSANVGDANTGDDRVVALWIEQNPQKVAACVEDARHAAVEEQVFKLISTLTPSKQSEVVRDLIGYTKVAGKTGTRT
mmetsp:Transcript_13466/g.36268  ORF Transcript_13466/g.36268 Transcript_13466/m.36268 type:complete len:2059 (-) Transcript_13466:87-6263(-)|eukprot:CAMPEP_0117502202 /NCGR_PEP_ID=MMETSP0784-20121206/23692_1 /TAXON_ID=39447 /ORGANISM="" /LENGTH=2058 /DNA_ID=CAMNT_0005297479 /DNA_START=30 /DNA_END=6206 /DNA_ORIENTATION=+